MIEKQQGIIYHRKKDPLYQSKSIPEGVSWSDESYPGTDSVFLICRLTERLRQLIDPANND